MSAPRFTISPIRESSIEYKNEFLRHPEGEAPIADLVSSIMDEKYYEHIIEFLAEDADYFPSLQQLVDACCDEINHRHQEATCDYGQERDDAFRSFRG